jgi:hypothetical protein
MADIAETLLAQIWNAQWLAGPLRTVDGLAVRVIYRGVWTHGFGPDFAGAMIDLDTELASGDVEIDFAASGWYRHGHQSNPSFDNVILHLVARADLAEPVRRSDGGRVPTVRLTDFLAGPLDGFHGIPGLRPLGAIGFDHCAPEIAATEPELLRAVWARAGDRRLDERVAAISGDLNLEKPTEVLYRRVLDAMGYSRNREGMRAVAERLPFAGLAPRLVSRPPDERLRISSALLLGVAGFLPLSPPDQRVADLDPDWVREIEREWGTHAARWRRDVVTPGVWRLARSRPAAHPVRRLLGTANLLGKSGDSLVDTIAALMTGDSPRRALMRWLTGNNRYLGAGHAHEIIVNVLIPFAIAYGREADQERLVDAAANLWASLPAGRGNAVTRRTIDQICGPHGITPASARAEQGLIHINRRGCSLMRCYECPVAHLALAWAAAPSDSTA